MLKKIKSICFMSLASLAVFVAEAALSTASFGHYGEPECPKELWK